MNLRLGRVFAHELLSRFGWLLAVLGVFMAGMQLYDQLTTERAVAAITDIKTSCQRQFERLGKTRWRKIDCSQIEDLRASGIKVRTRPYAQLSFTGTDGIARQAWVSLGKLELKTAAVGDQLAIAYRGGRRPYVVPASAPSVLRLGPAIFLAGLVMLMLARRIAPPAGFDPINPVPAPIPTGSSTATGKVRTPTAKSTPPRSGSVQTDRYQPPKRQGAVQRNRSWI
ncbi:MAG: hypothetical protein KDJ47_16255 [Hyphomicrobiaceae bacterium]|nr:hypothetical protein [Hyphomicrobiaceae bacterium]